MESATILMPLAPVLKPIIPEGQEYEKNIKIKCGFEVIKLLSL